MVGPRLNEAIQMTNALSRQQQGLMRVLLIWGPILVWIAFIFYLSSQSSVPSYQDQLIDLILKKTGHAIEYAVLACLSLRAFSLSESRPLSAKHYIAGLFLAVCYAGLDEFHQSFTPHRSPMVSDVLIDSVGAVIGLFIIFVWSRHYQNVTK